MTILEHHTITERTARYYSIGGSPNTKELWLVLHGYAHRAESFIKNFLPIADDETLVVAPEGLSRFYIKGFGGTVGASWMTREDRSNEIKDHVNYLDKVYHEVISSLFSPPKRTVLVGFSQGAPAALRLVTMGKSRADEIVVWCGDAPRDLDFNEFKKRSENSRMWFLKGDSDDIVRPEIYAETEDLYHKNGIQYEKIDFQGGHEIPQEPLLLLRERIHA
jgi:predicted esterase